MDRLETQKDAAAPGAPFGIAAQVGRALNRAGSAAERIEGAIDALAQAFQARTATLHRVDASQPVLHLVASRGIPESILPVTRVIPFGKGMAGLCAERGEPVTVCNLQTDSSGAVRPGAKATGVAGAVVVPVYRTAHGGGAKLLGTLGIGKAGEHDYTPEELEALAGCARLLADALDSLAAGA